MNSQPKHGTVEVVWEEFQIRSCDSKIFAGRTKAEALEWARRKVFRGAPLPIELWHHRTFREKARFGGWITHHLDEMERPLRAEEFAS